MRVSGTVRCYCWVIRIGSAFRGDHLGRGPGRRGRVPALIEYIHIRSRTAIIRIIIPRNVHVSGTVRCYCWSKRTGSAFRGDHLGCGPGRRGRAPALIEYITIRSRTAIIRIILPRNVRVSGPVRCHCWFIRITSAFRGDHLGRGPIPNRNF